jgi:hypothetical protein
MAAIAAAAFFVGRLTQPADEREPTPRTVNPDDDIREAKAAYDNAIRKLEAANAENTSLKQQLAEATAPPPEPETEPDSMAPTTDEPPSSAPRFVYKDQEAVLKELDWKVVGEAMNAMPPLLRNLAIGVREGKNVMQIEGIGEIQRWNGPLLTQAMKLKVGGLSGTGVNGAWTHPAAVVNQVYAVLVQTDRKMTEPQIEQLKALGDRFIEAEARRMASYEASTFRLQMVIEEAALRDELYAEIDTLLTPEQRNLLHAEDIRGSTKSDFYCSGMVWLTVAQPIRFRERGDLASQIANLIIARDRVPDAHRDTVRKIVDEWAQALPDKMLSVPHDAEAAIGIMKVTHITAGAKQTLKLRKALAQGVPDDGFRKACRESPGAAVPYRVPAPKQPVPEK